MREIFVTELVKEILGPRGGALEIMEGGRNPLSEYITGVLSPFRHRKAPDPESESEIPYEESRICDEGMEEAGVDTPPLLSPPLDPKSKPCSIGLSFEIQAKERPILDVCLTWAVYRVLESGSKWQRVPRYWIISVEADKDGDWWIGSDCQSTTHDRAEVSFHVRVSQHRQKSYFVSLYLVNRINLPSEAAEPRVEHHIYQPQIRVVCGAGTSLIPAGVWSERNEDRLAFLYRLRPILARGHLCSAVWREIDPERKYDGRLDFPSALRDPPFHWIDGDLLPDDVRAKFSSPDVRTEFVPLYSIPSPHLDWPLNHGEPPELAAGILSDAWDSRELRRRLQPILTAYERWINDLEGRIASLPPPEQDIASHLIGECDHVLDRIRRGIEFLCTDDDARLAFCFANQALDVRYSWTGRPLIWRPFQLAFILMALESLANPRSPDRDVCDLLWVPTGAGKTEAYLALIAFILAYRRRRALKRTDGDRTGAGVSVITRYTLRLLTIQQFRRALEVVTACEYLRVLGLRGGTIGWRPAGCPIREDFIWGSTSFSIGLWVGAGVTPNRLRRAWGGDRPIPGALDILKGELDEGEPAQVLTCPACRGILSIPEMGLSPGRHIIHLVINSVDSQNLRGLIDGLRDKHGKIAVTDAHLIPHDATGYFTLTLEIESSERMTAADVDGLWEVISKRLTGVELVPVRASRMGYFIRRYIGGRGREHEYDFDIICPNPACPLHRPWCGGTPSGLIHGRMPPEGEPIPRFPDGNTYIDVQSAFQLGCRHLADRIPIPALTVDEQIYKRLPSVLVATVDKFARPAFEPAASGLFGNVEFHHCMAGYYRRNGHIWGPEKDAHPRPGSHVRVHAPEPPDLILQDELHLLEGPLGSLVGIYETAVEFLSQESAGLPIKYIACTATVKRAEEQVQSLFARKLQTFPPPGLDADDRFFIRDFESHPLDDEKPGRLYLGVCAPGRGAHTPIVRIWARLLQTAWMNRKNPMIDSFWTLTGYFNAIRELAGVRALYRQDIPQRLVYISGGSPRPIPEDGMQELSSRTDSTDLPHLLDLLNRSYPNPSAQDALLTTSMFGTGVDIGRIGLMVVHGQPKTTSAYIQSTGRVGRTKGALVVTFFRASRPRDLNHYEFFCGYHRQLHRYVEPVTVSPFSNGSIERAGGPLIVFMLRNMRNASVPWYLDTSASLMANQRVTAPEVQEVVRTIERRASVQPLQHARFSASVRGLIDSALDIWKNYARIHGESLRFVEYAITVRPKHPVVLGDPQHQHARLDVVFRNAPQSLRDIEETTGFQIM